MAKQDKNVKIELDDVSENVVVSSQIELHPESPPPKPPPPPPKSAPIKGNKAKSKVVNEGDDPSPQQDDAKYFWQMNSFASFMSNPIMFIGKKFIHFRKPFWVVFGIILCISLTLLVLALPITEIVIGSMNVHQCPIDVKIPIWLIVLGSFPLIVITVSTACFCIPDDNVVRRTLQTFASIFLFVWLILGSIWVFKIKNEVTHAVVTVTEKYFSWPSNLPRTYCSYTCYYFSFWLLIITWSLLFLAFFLLLSFFIYLRCCRKYR